MKRKQEAENKRLQMIQTINQNELFNKLFDITLENVDENIITNYTEKEIRHFQSLKKY